MVADSSKMAEEEEDLTGVMWQDRTWLNIFPLNESTALDYFSMSQFYDRTCNNELVKMQNLDPVLLQTMPGLEYKLTNVPAPNLFIITKSRRTITPPSLEPLATYYIHEGNVYQAPTIHAVLSTRIMQSLHHLRAAFDTMQSSAVLSGHGRYVWDPPPHAADDLGDRAVEARELQSRMERSAVDRMLWDILEKNRRIHAEYEEKNVPPVDRAPGAVDEPGQPAGNAPPP